MYYHLRARVCTTSHVLLIDIMFGKNADALLSYRYKYFIKNCTVFLVVLLQFPVILDHFKRCVQRTINTYPKKTK